MLAYRHGRMDEVRAGVRSSAPLLLVGLGVMVVLAIAELPRIQDFIDSDTVSIVTDTDSKLRYPVPLPEAFGVWPSGEWLFGYGELGLDAWQLFAAVGLIALGFAAWWWLRRGDIALPAAVATAAVVYLWSILGAGLYVEAKALAGPRRADHAVHHRRAAAAERPSAPPRRAGRDGARARASRQRHRRHRLAGADRHPLHRPGRLLELPRAARRGDRTPRPLR